MKKSLAEQVQIQRAEEQLGSARVRFEMRLAIGKQAIRRRTVVTKGPWVCVGCGEIRAPKRRHYCPVCKRRLEHDIPLDIDDVLTRAECRALP